MASFVFYKLFNINLFLSFVLVGCFPRLGSADEPPKSQEKPATKPKSEPKKKQVSEKLENLQRVWSANGSFSGMAAAADTIYAVDRTRNCLILDPAGHEKKKFNFGSSPGKLRICRLPDKNVGLIPYDRFGKTLQAVDLSGKRLWRVSDSQGLQEAWPFDLNNDGVDEIIVGFNGNSGLALLSSKGKAIWAQPNLGNVGHVGVCDLNGDEKYEVVTTSSIGKIHVFDSSDGSPITILSPPVYSSFVRTAPDKIGKTPKCDLIIAVGSAPGAVGSNTVFGVNGSSNIYWSVDLPSTKLCNECLISPGKTMAALGFETGYFCVIDITKGQIVAQGFEPGGVSSVGWLGQEAGKALLLVNCGEGIIAFDVKPFDGR